MRVFDAWNAFFFRPIPAYSLGLFRIGLAAVALFNFLLLAPDALMWYGEKGVFPSEYAARIVEGPRLNALTFLPRSDFAVECFLGFSAIVALFVLVGFKTRVASVLLYVCLVSFHQRNFYLLHAGDTLMRNFAFLLMFAPSDKAFSLDRWLCIRRGLETPGEPLVSPWAQRLLQIQLCVMYLTTAIWKLMGKPWINGTAVYYVLQLEEFQRFPVPAFMLTPWFSALATWSTLAVEVALPILIWVPRLRVPVLCGGVLLHLGLDYALNIPMFQWVVLASYVLFLDPETLRRFRFWKRPAPAMTAAGPSPAR